MRKRLASVVLSVSVALPAVLGVGIVVPQIAAAASLSCTGGAYTFNSAKTTIESVGYLDCTPASAGLGVNVYLEKYTSSGWQVVAGKSYRLTGSVTHVNTYFYYGSAQVGATYRTETDPWFFNGSYWGTIPGWWWSANLLFT